MSRDPLQVWIPRPSRAGGAAGLPGQGRAAPRCPHRVRAVPGATGLPSTGPWLKILTRIRAQKGAQSGVASCHPLGPCPPGEGRRGEICTGGDFSADRTHAHTRTHTPSSATERSVKTRFTHTLSVCARLTRYSTAGDQAGKVGGLGGRQWLRYCTGVNVNNKASSERASPETRTAALYKNALKTTRFS